MTLIVPHRVHRSKPAARAQQQASLGRVGTWLARFSRGVGDGCRDAIVEGAKVALDVTGNVVGPLVPAHHWSNRSKAFQSGDPIGYTVRGLVDLPRTIVSIDWKRAVSDPYTLGYLTGSVAPQVAMPLAGKALGGVVGGVVGGAVGDAVSNGIRWPKNPTTFVPQPGGLAPAIAMAVPKTGPVTMGRRIGEALGIGLGGQTVTMSDDLGHGTAGAGEPEHGSPTPVPAVDPAKTKHIVTFLAEYIGKRAKTLRKAVKTGEVANDEVIEATTAADAHKMLESISKGQDAMAREADALKRMTAAQRKALLAQMQPAEREALSTLLGGEGEIGAAPMRKKLPSPFSKEGQQFLEEAGVFADLDAKYGKGAGMAMYKMLANSASMSTRAGEGGFRAIFARMQPKMQQQVIEAYCTFTRKATALATENRSIPNETWAKMAGTSDPRAKLTTLDEWLARSPADADAVRKAMTKQPWSFTTGTPKGWMGPPRR